MSEEEWRDMYFSLGKELGEIINSQQDVMLAQSRRIKRLERENWQLKQRRK